MTNVGCASALELVPVIADVAVETAVKGVAATPHTKGQACQYLHY